MANIAYRIDDELNVSVVQGEERSLRIRLFDAKTLVPIDLSGAAVAIDFLSTSMSYFPKSSPLNYWPERT